jgi:hypothetical protein
MTKAVIQPTLPQLVVQDRAVSCCMSVAFSHILILYAGTEIRCMREAARAKTGDNKRSVRLLWESK